MPNNLSSNRLLHIYSTKQKLYNKTKKKQKKTESNLKATISVYDDNLLEMMSHHTFQKREKQQPVKETTSLKRL